MSFESYVCVGCGCSESSPCDMEGGTCTWLRQDDELGTGVCGGCPDLLGRWDESQHHLSPEPAERILDVIAAAENANLPLYRYWQDDRVVAYEFGPGARVRGCNGEYLKGLDVRPITAYIPLVDTTSMVLHLFDSAAEALRQVVDLQYTLGSPACIILGGGREAGSACALLCFHPPGGSPPKFGVVDRRLATKLSGAKANPVEALGVVGRMERQADYLEHEENREIHVGDPNHRVPAISKELRYFAGELRRHLPAGT